MSEYDVVAEPRTELGKGAMRRMRRAGKLPGVVYGTGKEPIPILFSERTLRRQMENEAFFSRILNLKIEGQADAQAVVKALQRHPASSRVMHVDLLRVSATQKLTLVVPLHFEGEDAAPGVKMGGVVSHQVTEVEISCLPADLPEYIAVDVSSVDLGAALHLSELILPSGVELIALTDDNDPPVLNIALPKAIEEEVVEEDSEEASDDVSLSEDAAASDEVDNEEE